MTPVFRFAPSPTGYLHIGGARTALFNWLLARQSGGRFLLRIEDTDKARSSDEMVAVIREGLAWLGLDPDGDVVFQGANAARHAAVAQALLESGRAYRCFATPAELEAMREQARVEKWRVSYDKRGLSLSESEVQEKLAAGLPHVIRFNVDPEDQIQWQDKVFGEQSYSGRDMEDFVILRSDGSPLYNLSVVCDDHDMGVTQVVRGQDHLPNTPKQILIYRAMGWPVPEFGHLPLIMAPGKKKLSKRFHGEVVSLTTYRDRGFVPEAFRNFLALLGWHPGGDREFFREAELVSEFSCERINRANAVVNFQENSAREWTDRKALHLNNAWIRELASESLLELARPFLVRGGCLTQHEAEQPELQTRISELLLATRERIFLLEEFAPTLLPYFRDDYPLDEAALKKQVLKHESLRELLPSLAERLEAQADWNLESCEHSLRSLAEEQGCSAGQLINGSRVVLTGMGVGPGIFDVYVLLGRERCVTRLKATPRHFED